MRMDILARNATPHGIVMEEFVLLLLLAPLLRLFSRDVVTPVPDLKNIKTLWKNIQAQSFGRV